MESTHDIHFKVFTVAAYQFLYCCLNYLSSLLSAACPWNSLCVWYACKALTRGLYNASDLQVFYTSDCLSQCGKMYQWSRSHMHGLQIVEGLVLIQYIYIYIYIYIKIISLTTRVTLTHLNTHSYTDVTICQARCWYAPQEQCGAQCLDDLHYLLCHSMFPHVALSAWSNDHGRHSALYW